jgi:hypothetical protein
MSDSDSDDISIVSGSNSVSLSSVSASSSSSSSSRSSSSDSEDSAPSSAQRRKAKTKTTNNRRGGTASKSKSKKVAKGKATKTASRSKSTSKKTTTKKTTTKKTTSKAKPKSKAKTKANSKAKNTTRARAKSKTKAKAKTKTKTKTKSKTKPKTKTKTAATKSKAGKSAAPKRKRKSARDESKAVWKDGHLVVFEPDDIQRVWQVPAIAHFVWLFQAPLCLNAVLPAALERAFKHPDESDLFCELLSKVLTQSHKHRKLLAQGECYPYAVVESLIALRLEEWYDDELQKWITSALDYANGEYNMPYDTDDSEDDDRFLLPDGIDPRKNEHLSTCLRMDKFHPRHSVGDTNPLLNCSFAELPVNRRVAIAQALCDELQRGSTKFSSYLEDIHPSEARVVPFGKDKQGNQYLYFGFDDCRIYVQTNPTGRSKEPKFRLLSQTIEEYNDVLLYFKSSRNEVERDLHEQLDLLGDSFREKVELERERKEREAKRSEAQAKWAAMAPAKRSSRLARKESERKLREEQENRALVEIAKYRREDLQVLGFRERGRAEARLQSLRSMHSRSVALTQQAHAQHLEREHAGYEDDDMESANSDVSDISADEEDEEQSQDRQAQVQAQAQQQEPVVATGESPISAPSEVTATAATSGPSGIKRKAVSDVEDTIRPPSPKRSKPEDASTAAPADAVQKARLHLHGPHFSTTHSMPDVPVPAPAPAPAPAQQQPQQQAE